MILEHVTHHARLVVIPSPTAHIHTFGHRDLYIVHVIAIPNRFKNGVGKAEIQNIEAGNGTGPQRLLLALIEFEEIE